jgi:saccharopine dehydrogenase (NADP+, L-glutamate forming)
MLTTSYVSPEMKALDTRTREAGIVILNEIGVDPGYDHMTAMEIIDRVHEEGGKVDAFHSLCGALCTAEASDNPFRYKFSWTPPRYSTSPWRLISPDLKQCMCTRS